LRWIRSRLSKQNPTVSRELALNLAGILEYAAVEKIPRNESCYDGDILLYVANRQTATRADAFWSKEPGTIDWINRFKAGAIFWDVGANVGVYSLYAALKAKAQVLAFEPAAANYSTLNKNIELNRLSEKISALCLCLADKSEINQLNMISTVAGSSLHNFGEAVDYKGDTFTPRFKQGAAAVSADTLVQSFAAPKPNYMKLDVDGLEKSIMTGARGVLADPGFVSLLVEINLNDTEEVRFTRELTRSCGLVEDHSIASNVARTIGGVQIQNLIFTRP
jgi:FkbM family methyltransferase